MILDLDRCAHMSCPSANGKERGGRVARCARQDYSILYPQPVRGEFLIGFCTLHRHILSGLTRHPPASGDKMLEAPYQTTKLMARLILPGAALINNLPFCAVSNSVPAMLIVAHNYFSAITAIRISLRPLGNLIHSKHPAPRASIRGITGIMVCIY